MKNLDTTELLNSTFLHVLDAKNPTQCLVNGIDISFPVLKQHKTCYFISYNNATINDMKLYPSRCLPSQNARLTQGCSSWGCTVTIMDPIRMRGRRLNFILVFLWGKGLMNGHVEVRGRGRGCLHFVLVLSWAKCRIHQRHFIAFYSIDPHLCISLVQRDLASFFKIGYGACGPLNNCYWPWLSVGQAF